MTKENNIYLLKRVKRIISTPDKWCKNANFQDRKGLVCNYEEAAKFCLSGALLFASDSPPTNTLEVVKQIHALLPETLTMTAFNDLPSTTHEDVIGLLDKALEAFEKQ